MPRRSRSILTGTLATCGLALGLVAAASPAAGASTVGVRAPQVTGWYGYVDTNSSGNTYSQASGQWAVPAASCTATASELALWVGIDGFTSSTVEQAGTLTDCSGGTPTYFTWWEMFPGSVHIVGDTVHPGDKITTSVTKSGTTYTLKVTDATTAANSFSVKESCSACTDTSAEWIAEPSAAYPPASIHWKLTNATVKSGSITGVIATFPHVSSGAPLTSPLNSAGNSFTVT
ncbi:MAG TPA: G1 family glutamic endopeptidase [Streptosporangiaceae bacterium]